MKSQPLSVMHPRLDAFYNSTVLNFSMMAAVLAAMTMRFPSLFTAAACVGSLAFAFVAGYSVWFWTGRRKTVAQSRFVSNISSAFVFYFLIVSAIKVPSAFCIVFAYIAAGLTLVVYLVGRYKRCC